ncbi:MAG TPA: deoxyguanosinetriphosphate triphosphohydrolase [Rhizomicrobium sp.]|jgi:dGTPase|nr:deoxyguanosinetriphosphate triphosphohydrolase [Rhizomicrobium sp.]
MAETNPAETAPPGRLLGSIVSPPGPHAPYATQPQLSRGRFYPEPESATRSCYSRDRDRIIHSSAFRRLKHKTQVFVQHEGDYYRTRLTHSLEVAQLARSLARTLSADEDLAETVALAHDLGHTPFGHAGEEALDAVTRDIGGFDHNAHALRLVTKLEHRYADFDGLNLTWETLEGLVKHNGPLISPSALRIASAATGTSPARAEEEAQNDLGNKLPGPIASFDKRWSLELSSWPGLEAQLAALADDIAYVSHDIDDGLRAGIFTIHDLTEAPLAGEHVKGVLERHGELELSRFIGELIRTLMSELMEDVMAQTRENLAGVASVAAVRGAGRATASFSPTLLQRLKALKRFQMQNMYRHPRVMTSMTRAQAVVTGLYEAFVADPGLLPPDWADAARAAVPGTVARDYIAGMTDRYALAEYARVFHTEIQL